MCTDCIVTRMSSDRVAMRPIVNRMTARRLWKHYLPLRSVIKKKFAFNVVVTITRTRPFTQIFLPGDKTVVRAISLSLWLWIITLFVPYSHATGIWTLAPGFPITPVTIFWTKNNEIFVNKGRLLYCCTLTIKFVRIRLGYWNLKREICSVFSN